MRKADYLTLAQILRSDIAFSDESDDYDDENVWGIYLKNVLAWGLPIDDDMRAFMASRYVPEFLNKFASWGKV